MHQTGRDISVHTCEELKQQTPDRPDVNLLVVRSRILLGSTPQWRHLALGLAASCILLPKRKELRASVQGCCSGCGSMCSQAPTASRVFQYLQRKPYLHY